MAAEQVSLDQKKAQRCGGVVLFGDEVSFWLDGTLHQTWARLGHQPRVDTYGQRKTAHVFGAISMDGARFFYQFASVFDAQSFLRFLKHLVAQQQGRKVFLIVDNGPCHNLDEEGKTWLKEHADRIALYRLPPYSPEFNPIEGVWKMTRRMTTHNRFFATTQERDAALRATFRKFQLRPALIAPQVARFR